VKSGIFFSYTFYFSDDESEVEGFSFSINFSLDRSKPILKIGYHR
jgi:hypothetical protein